MKNLSVIYSLAALLFVSASFTFCTTQTNGQEQTQTHEATTTKGGTLSAAEFNKSLTSAAGAQIIDVRTPKEFKGGHLQNAMNVDWNGNSFAEHSAQLDKNKPVFVYCLSGGRSAEAAENLRAAGFTEVYNLDGGTQAWKAANLPLTEPTGAATDPGMSETEYAGLLQTEKLLLVDFNAPWCAPCRKMKPMLEELKTAEAGRMELKLINADDNKMLAESQQVSVLPTLILYKNGEKVWRKEGFTSREEILAALDKFD